MIYSVSLAYTFINLLLSGTLLILARRNNINRFFLFCVVVLDATGLAAFSLKEIPDPTAQYAIHAALTFCFSLLPFFFLHFLAVFFRRFDITRSRLSLAVLYFAGLFSYAMILLGYLPAPIEDSHSITTNGFLFYVTWHSILFCIGIAILYEYRSGFFGKVEKGSMLFAIFAGLLLILPGPFINTVYLRFLHLSIDFYFLTCTLAVVFSVYFIFRYKVVVNTIYDALKAALAVLDDVFIITDDRFSIQLARGGAGRIWQYDQEELVGKDFASLLKQRDLLQIYREYAFRGKMTQSYFDADVYCKDGAEVPMNFSFTPVYGGGEIVGFVSIGRNISDLRKSAQSLQIYRNALDSTPEFIAISDTNDQLIYANKALEQRYGYTQRGILGKSMQALVSPTTAEKGLPVGASDPDKPWSGDVMHVTNTGEEFPVHVVISPIVDEESSVIGKVCAAEDITEKLAAARALEESEAQYRSLFDNVPVGLFRMAPDGSIVKVNKTLAATLGYGEITPGVLQSIRERFESDSATRSAWAGLLSGKHDIYNLETAIEQDGKVLFFLQSIKTFRNAAGEIEYFEGTLTEITERKKLEHDLLHVQRMESIGTLAGGIAHDFNNILQIILIYGLKLKNPKGGQAELEQSVQHILDYVHRGANLVRQLMTFARKTDDSLEPHDLHAVLSDVRTMLTQTFPKNIDIDIDLAPGSATIRGNKTQLHQVMINLCVNARDAMPHGGRLSVATRIIQGGERPSAGSPDHDGANYLQVTVSDTGVGMDEKVQKRIFEPFFTTKDVNRGTGLGLAVVYGIIRSHNGTITVESEVGKGTQFTIMLPLYEEPPAYAPAAPSPVVIGTDHNETILLVEDELEVCTTMQSILEHAGYQVITAMDGQTALDLYCRRHASISLVLINLGLPRIGGMELFGQMQKVHPGVHAVFSSGFFDPAFKTQATTAGVRAFIEKPFSERDLLEPVHRILKESRTTPSHSA